LVDNPWSASFVIFLIAAAFSRIFGFLGHAPALVDDPASPGFDWEVPFGASGIQQALLAEGRLVLREERRAPTYWVQRYERVTRLSQFLGGRRAEVASRESVDVPPLSPEVAAHFRMNGTRNGGHGSTATTSRLPILMYHRVSNDWSPATRRWTVTPAELEEQLALLREHEFRAVTFEEWGKAGFDHRPLPGRRVMLTFDDGYSDFAEHALPLIERYGFEAELFVVTGHVGATNDWETTLRERYRLMDWATIAQLPPKTVHIGSHTDTHRMLTAVSAEVATRELVRSRLTLEQRLGRGVSSLAYPYGPASGAVQQLARAAGYDFALTTLEWRAYLGADLMKLPRLEVYGGQSFSEFERMMIGS